MAGTRKTTRTTETKNKTVETGVDVKTYQAKVSELETKIVTLEDKLSEALSKVKVLEEKVKSIPQDVSSNSTVDGEARSAIRTIITMLRSNRRPNMDWPNI
tara:strand:+ start:282 stop:584 length:303 start_codon:yes stop_codon:yes gene_type:complete